MQHIKKLFAVSFVFAGLVSVGGCDVAKFGGGNGDCHINGNYEITCGDFDPGLKPN